MSFRVEIERADGDVEWYKFRGEIREWRYPEQADKFAEEMWLNYGDTGNYARFSVVEDDGETYSDWEC